MHSGQIMLSVQQVERIVAEQFPQWSDLSITAVHGGGTVNHIFRLGNDLSARFPLVVDDPARTLERLEKEADAIIEFADAISVLAPSPVAIGRQSPDYPGPWAAQTWISGRPAVDADVLNSDVLARDIVQLIKELRAVPTDDRAFKGDGRGGDLQMHDNWMETCFNQSAGMLDAPRLRRVWSRMRELPREQPDMMTHGDLLPTNLLVRGQQLVGVLDAGGFGPADPALDLMGVWSLFDRARRQVVRDELKCSALGWAGGQAWAFEPAMGAVWYYVESNHKMSMMGQRALADIVQEWNVS
ncbi:MAG: phosphotransferase [Acidimicrobiales bacterium]